ncbi:TraR/DksA family transcriptional regulator [Pseudomonas aeruginosa]|uniref:TraR/DksA family transcriptional regulator n=1 Tax=Pseudomonas aeruginosa TaxID=287 RepID=UPI003F1B435F
MDIVDIANDYAERELAERLYSRVKYVGESLSECEDCGEEIPVARRSIVPGCCR